MRMRRTFTATSGIKAELTIQVDGLVVQAHAKWLGKQTPADEREAEAEIMEVVGPAILQLRKEIAQGATKHERN